MRSDRLVATICAIAAGAVVLHGYHFGIEDQAVFLSAIKHRLDPGLYPHDAAFFLTEVRFTLFDELIALSALGRADWIEPAAFAWHLIGLTAVLIGCWNVAGLCAFQNAVVHVCRLDELTR